MNSRNFSGGYKEILPEVEALPSILTTSPVKRTLAGPREWAQNFDYYAVDALHDNRTVSAHEKPEIERFLEDYTNTETQHVLSDIRNRMLLRSRSNPAFNVAVDELQFHTINRVLADQWRSLLFGDEFAPSHARISMAQEQLAISGLHLMALSKQLADTARRTGVRSSSHALAEEHLTEVDAAITLLEYQKIQLAETGENNLVIVPAPYRFRYSQQPERRAQFLVANRALDTVRGVRAQTTLTEEEIKQTFDARFVTPIAGTFDLNNFDIASTPHSDSVQIIPKPGLVSVGVLTQQAEFSIAAAARETEFSTRDSLGALLEAKRIAKEVAMRETQFDFSTRAQNAAQRIGGRITADLKRKSFPDIENDTP